MSTSAPFRIVVAAWFLTGGLHLMGATLELKRTPPVSSEASSARQADDTPPSESLEEAWRIALSVDQALQAQRWYVSSARSSERSAEAQRLPTIAMEGSYTGRSDAQAVRFRSANPLQPTIVSPLGQTENAAFRWRVDVPLYTSGAIRHGIDAAKAGVDSADLQTERSVADLKMQVAEQYVAVLRAQRDLVVTRTTARSLESHARDTAELFDHGQVPRNDLLAAQSTLSNALQNVVRAQHQLEACRAAYNRSLARPLTAAVRLQELRITPIDKSLDSLTSQALRMRQEPARLTAQIKALRHQAAEFRSQNKLQVNLRGEYAFEENRYRMPEGIGSLGVLASWNVFDGGRNRHQAASLQREADGLVRMRNDLRSQIALEVRQAWLEVEEARQRKVLASETIRRAEENLRVVRQRYQAGAAISTEVLDAEALRAQAYQNRDHANYDAVLATLRVRHATGSL